MSDDNIIEFPGQPEGNKSAVDYAVEVAEQWPDRLKKANENCIAAIEHMLAIAKAGDMTSLSAAWTNSEVTVPIDGVFPSVTGSYTDAVVVGSIRTDGLRLMAISDLNKRQIMDALEPTEGQLHVEVTPPLTD